MTKKSCEAHQRSTVWGDAKPCGKPHRANGLCTSHLAQLERRRSNKEMLTPLLGVNGQKYKRKVSLSVSMESADAKRLTELGKSLGATRSRARGRGLMAIVHGYLRWELAWLPGKGPPIKPKS